MTIPVFTFTACNNDRNDDETVTVIDMVGDTVELPKNPKKVAVLARSAVDMLIAFGLGDRITGVFETTFTNEWAGIIYPNLENFASYNYNTTFETYLEHGVDMIFAPEKYLTDGFREKGIPSVTVSQYGNPTYDEYTTYFADMVKQIWDDKEVVIKVDKWKADFKEIEDEVAEKLKDITPTKTFFYVRGDRNRGINYTENTTATMQGTIARMLKLNIINFDVSQPTEEAVLEADPDYMVVGGAFQQTLIASAKSNPVWSNLSAVKNDTLFNIGIGFVAFEQNSVELPLYVATLANKIYPDLFEFDTHKLLKDTLKYYFGSDLTDADIAHMLNGHNSQGQPLA